MTTKIPGYCTTTEAAERLGIHTSLVCRYCREQRLEAINLGKQWMIDEHKLSEFENQERRVGNPNFGPDFWN